MKKKSNRTRRLALPSWLMRGLDQAERERRVDNLMRPMRHLMSMLEQGEVYEIDGRAVMRMPEVDPEFADQTEWCEIAPAIAGWIDCWARIDPSIQLDHLAILGRRLDADKTITPRLAEKARADLETCAARLLTVRPGAITSAVTSTCIAWEFEKLEENAE